VESTPARKDLRAAVADHVICGANAGTPVALPLERAVDQVAGPIAQAGPRLVRMAERRIAADQLLLFIANAGAQREPSHLPGVLHEEVQVILRRLRVRSEVRARRAVNPSERRIGQDLHSRAVARSSAVR